MRSAHFTLARLTPYDLFVSSEKTPSEAAVLWYLRARRVENKGPATREDILRDVKISEITLTRVLIKLKRSGDVERIEGYKATEFTFSGEESDTPIT